MIDDSSAPGVWPKWVTRFVYESWVDESESPPAFWDRDVAMWWGMRARRRWQEAGKAWALEHGRTLHDWYEATRLCVATGEGGSHGRG